MHPLSWVQTLLSNTYPTPSCKRGCSGDSPLPCLSHPILSSPGSHDLHTLAFPFPLRSGCLGFLLPLPSSALFLQPSPACKHIPQTFRTHIPRPPTWPLPEVSAEASRGRAGWAAVRRHHRPAPSSCLWQIFADARRTQFRPRACPQMSPPDSRSRPHGDFHPHVGNCFCVPAPRAWPSARGLPGKRAGLPCLSSAGSPTIHA